MDYQAETQQILEAFYAEAQEHFECPPLETIEILFNLRGKCHGQAWWRRCRGVAVDFRIRINPEIFIHGFDHYYSTIGHELAHIIAVHHYGLILGDGHGFGWQNVMVKLGLEPERCTDVHLTPARKVKRKRFVYACQKCGEELYLTTTKHNREQRSSYGHYYHKVDKGDLSFTGKVVTLD